MPSVTSSDGRKVFSPPLTVAMIYILLGVLEYHKFILYIYIVHDDLHYIFGIEQRELLQRL